MERILKVTKKSGNRERDVGCCLYENEEQSLDETFWSDSSITQNIIPELKDCYENMSKGTKLQDY